MVIFIKDNGIHGKKNDAGQAVYISILPLLLISFKIMIKLPTLLMDYVCIC